MTTNTPSTKHQKKNILQLQQKSYQNNWSYQKNDNKHVLDQLTNILDISHTHHSCSHFWHFAHTPPWQTIIYCFFLLQKTTSKNLNKKISLNFSLLPNVFFNFLFSYITVTTRPNATIQYSNPISKSQNSEKKRRFHLLFFYRRPILFNFFKNKHLKKKSSTSKKRKTRPKRKLALPRHYQTKDNDAFDLNPSILLFLFSYALSSSINHFFFFFFPFVLQQQKLFILFSPLPIQWKTCKTKCKKIWPKKYL